MRDWFPYSYLLSAPLFCKKKSNLLKGVVFTDKRILLLGKIQNTSNVLGLSRIELKHWVKLFLGVKVMAMNIHRLPGKVRRMGPIMGHTMHYRYRIINFKQVIPFHLLEKKELKSKYFNTMAIYKYKTSIPSTRNGTVNSQ